MDLEDFEPKRPANHEIGADLSTLSVSELEDLIEKLKTEISRIRTALSEKTVSLSAADSLFKN